MDTIDAILRRKAKAGVRGYQYEVLVAGEVVASSKDPEHAACRALLARGLSGRIRFWREGRTTHDNELDIERGARVSVSESDRGGVRGVKYNYFWAKQEDGETVELEDAA